MAAAKWIVGLGNPGRRYDASRHNVGFLVADRLIGLHPFGQERRKFNALLWEGAIDGPRGPTKVFVVKPQTYMNLSGPAVRDCLAYHGTATGEELGDDLLVIHDDLDLPAGRLRFRAGGSAGGHRGVDSIISSLGHGRFSRLKIGVGRRPGSEAAEYVLEPVAPADRAAFEESVGEAARAAWVWVDEGVGAASNRFNGPAADGPGEGVDRVGGAPEVAEPRQRQDAGERRRSSGG